MYSLPASMKSLVTTGLQNEPKKTLADLENPHKILNQEISDTKKPQLTSYNSQDTIKILLKNFEEAHLGAKEVIAESEKIHADFSDLLKSLQEDFKESPKATTLPNSKKVQFDDGISVMNIRNQGTSRRCASRFEHQQEIFERYIKEERDSPSLDEKQHIDWVLGKESPHDKFGFPSLLPISEADCITAYNRKQTPVEYMGSRLSEAYPPPDPSLPESSKHRGHGNVNESKKQLQSLNDPELAEFEIIDSLTIGTLPNGTRLVEAMAAMPDTTPCSDIGSENSWSITAVREIASRLFVGLLE